MMITYFPILSDDNTFLCYRTEFFSRILFSNVYIHRAAKHLNVSSNRFLVMSRLELDSSIQGGLKRNLFRKKFKVNPSFAHRFEYPRSSESKNNRNPAASMSEMLSASAFEFDWWPYRKLYWKCIPLYFIQASRSPKMYCPQLSTLIRLTWLPSTLENKFTT